MPQTKRSRSRVLAMQALCALDAVGEAFEPDLDKFLHDGVNYVDLGWKRTPGQEVLAFARVLALGTWRQRERCDELLKANAAGWSVERMQPVDRNILRLGLYELMECAETPPAVVLDEAVELAHLFGGEESLGFVNGVLDAVRRKMASGE
jgi:transcription antitermination protein NusB